MEKVSKIKYLLLFAVLPGAFFSVGEIAYAANIYFSPSSGAYAVDSIVPVAIYVSSTDQAMNAASGVINFPQDKLEVASLSKTGSIFSLWVQEPTFSNSAGRVNFEGIALNPGFTGDSGKLITVNFRVKAAGVAALNFASGSALANDGQGTNILANLGDAQFSFGGAVQVVPGSTAAPVSSRTPSAPEIYSPTHPDSAKWYSDTTTKFSWKLSSGTTGVRLLIDHKTETTPTVSYIPPIDSKTIDELENGVWYLHARLRNSAGWGKISHFKVQIDTDDPDHFNISELPSEEKTNSVARFMFDATDKLSGIDRYEVSFDTEISQTWKDDGTHTFVTPVMSPGTHTITARAFDRAENSVESKATFTIGSLQPPRITEYPKSVIVGDSIIIKGVTSPYSDVTIWCEGVADSVFANNKIDVASTTSSVKNYLDRHSHIVRADKDGVFVLEHPKIDIPGVYTAWAEVVDANGEKSTPSDKIVIKVNRAGSPLFSGAGAG
ncbi:MAG: hypothetical protein HY980_00180, partial [Candidatus Magasanikbacteria bacterium]|nr:hypothetical protein [Candidatus Magasanikbacteria bacterium]